MDIRILSDLHTEFSGNTHVITKLPTDKETTLVLAGDIGNGLFHLDFLKECTEQFKYVIYVAGNHDYWAHGRDIDSVVEDWRGLSRAFENLYFLENEVVILDGVRFIGGTLWTDMDRSNIQLIVTLQDGNYPDFYEIVKEDETKDPPFRSFSPYDAMRRHDYTRDYIFQMLSEKHDGPTVVVTHFLPLWACINECFFGAGDMGINGYYASNLEYIFENRDFDVWIHGHTHNNVFLKDVYGKSVHANPYGYHGHFLNDDFDPTYTITV